MKILVVIPAFNEETLLERSVARLHGYLSLVRRFEFEIVIADNGSTDRTPAIADSLGRKYSGVRARHLHSKGRGGALKTVWSESQADILSYMDADLSSDLAAFPALISPLADGQFDLATGSRLLDPKRTTRCFHREVTSRGYNLLVRVMLGARFSDAQCGFKAITREAAQQLLPMVEDRGWFFDTELLAIAEKLGYRLWDLPVCWVENRASHVKIIRTAVDDVRGLIRLRRKLAHMRARKPDPVSLNVASEIPARSIR